MEEKPYDGLERRANDPQADFRRRVYGEIADIKTRVDELERAMQETAPVADEAHKMASEHERTLYGLSDPNRAEPGMVWVVNDIAKTFSDVRAVTKAIWAVVTVGGLSLLVSLYSIWMTFSRTV